MVLIDGDEASLVEKIGEAEILADRIKIVRVAALDEAGTRWWVYDVEACREDAGPGVGHLVRADGSAVAAHNVQVGERALVTDLAGAFPTEGGAASYAIRYQYESALQRTQYVSYHGVTVRSPVVRSEIGDSGHVASIRVTVTSPLTETGRGYATLLTAQVGRVETGDSIDAPVGVLTVPSFFWRGDSSASATLSVVRLFEPSVLSGDPWALPVLLGASKPTPVTIDDGQTTDVELAIGPIATAERELFVPTEVGNHETRIGYGPAADNLGIYSAPVTWHSRIPVIEEDGYRGAWVIRAPHPRDATTPGVKVSEHGGSGDFLVPVSGPVIAPIYTAATISPSSLSGSAASLVIDWTIPNRCLCRAQITSPDLTRTWIAYTVGPIALRDMGPLFFSGKHRLLLDCFPEIASVDEVLTGDRGKRFADGSGRRAKVHSMAMIDLR